MELFDLAEPANGKKNFSNTKNNYFHAVHDCKLEKHFGGLIIASYTAKDSNCPNSLKDIAWNNKSLQRF